MSQIALPAARPCDGWVRFPISDYMVMLNIRIDIEKELWSALEYYSEVEEVGISLLQARGLPQSQHQEILKYLQAFVRQAKSYYSSAKVLHYRSSSLLYYYSFLNLVKAYILLRDPNRMMGRTARAVVHGLSYRSRTNNTDFLHEVIKVVEGIFPTFYEMQTGTTISTTQKSTLNIISLFSYCSDMQHQYVSAGYGSTKLLPSLATIVTDRSVNQAWSIIGIPALNDLNSFLSAQRNFLQTYQEV